MGEPDEYLVDVSAPSSHGSSLRFKRCPVCERQFSDDENAEAIRRHITGHDPEEFGLTAEPGDTFDDEPAFERVLGGDR